jgi:hypothetical protein
MRIHSLLLALAVLLASTATNVSAQSAFDYTKDTSTHTTVDPPSPIPGAEDERTRKITGGKPKLKGYVDVTLDSFATDTKDKSRSPLLLHIDPNTPEIVTAYKAHEGKDERGYGGKTELYVGGNLASPKDMVGWKNLHTWNGI